MAGLNNQNIHVCNAINARTTHTNVRSSFFNDTCQIRKRVKVANTDQFANKVTGESFLINGGCH